MGIGRACAERLAAEGALVIITDVVDEIGMSTAEAISAQGGTATYLHHDVTREAEWVAVLKQVQQLHDGLDILVNNAGIALQVPIFEMTLADFHNYRGHWRRIGDQCFIGCRAQGRAGLVCLRDD
jgi:NAD(P)-dependent dehydrogenase (short-subunit alcohol dehydrogenase family)